MSLSAIRLPTLLVSIAICQDADGRYSLNDLHRTAVSGGANKRSTEPSKFMGSPQTVALIEIGPVSWNFPARRLSVIRDTDCSFSHLQDPTL